MIDPTLCKPTQPVSMSFHWFVVIVIAAVVFLIVFRGYRERQRLIAYTEAVECENKVRENWIRTLREEAWYTGHIGYESNSPLTTGQYNTCFGEDAQRSFGMGRGRVLEKEREEQDAREKAREWNLREGR